MATQITMDGEPSKQVDHRAVLTACIHRISRRGASDKRYDAIAAGILNVNDRRKATLRRERRFEGVFIGARSDLQSASPAVVRGRTAPNSHAPVWDASSIQNIHSTVRVMSTTEPMNAPATPPVIPPGRRAAIVPPAARATAPVMAPIVIAFPIALSIRVSDRLATVAVSAGLCSALQLSSPLRLHVYGQHLRKRCLRE